MTPASWAKYLAVLILWLGGLVPLRAQEATFFVAASLGDILSELADGFEQDTGRTINLVSGASSTLLKQILSGAPADGYISANLAYADFVADFVETEPVDLFGNRLVLIARADFDGDVDIANLVELVADGRLAVGDPDHVPAGIYARQALENLGLWEALQGRLAPAGNVRGAVGFVAHGAAAFGITYLTDARFGGVKQVVLIDQSLHDPIRYWGVVLGEADLSVASETAEMFLTFIGSFKSQVLLDYEGFLAVMSPDA